MTEKYLVIIDVDKIQEYIFRNIRLKPIVGASLLVAQLTSRAFCKAESVLKYLGEVENFSQLTSEGSQYLPLFFGGGNIKVIFTTYKNSYDFIEDMQKIFITNAPGASFSNVIFKFSSDFDSTIIEKAEKELKKIKQSKLSRIKPDTNPLFDLCDLCGTYPSGYTHPYDRTKHVCENCLKTLESFKNVSSLNNHDVLLKKFYDEFKVKSNCEFMDEFDEIKDDKSYLAVITMDANSIGDKIKEIISNKKDDESVNELRSFSEGLNENIITVLRKSIEGIFANDIEKIPFRPIIIGGDDICLVIAGNKAITYVCRFIEELGKNNFCKENTITFSIGISFVKSHYPFSFAHKLSEQLLKNAKSEKSLGNIIDWVALNTSTFESLSLIRNEQYTIKDDATGMDYILTYKPYNFTGNSCKNFLNVIGASQKLCKVLKNTRFKELRQIVRKGGAASNFEFRKIMSKLSDGERTEINNKVLQNFKLNVEDIWLDDNEKRYNNFLDMIEIFDFIE